MRLEPSEIQTIVKLSRENFGAETRVILFGSRVDDTRRGGDIDLLIIPSEHKPMQELLRNQVRFLSVLKMQIGDQKIDVVIKTEDERNSPLINQAESEGIALC